MSAMRVRGRPRGVVRRRAVVFLPNGLTLFNLFCGIYAIINAARGNLQSASFFIVLGGVADALDGRVARATNTGSRFGEELDSLVDAISFGFAPALAMYFAVLNRGNWEWLLVFIFTSCAVMRLARFNVEQAGRAKTHFHGLPSPAAGLTLATYYWFSQTDLYNQTVILFTDSKTLSDLPWHTMLRGLMAVLAGLMVSDVPYPAVPSLGFKTLRQTIGSIIVVLSVAGLIFLPRQFIFPALLAYVAYPLIKSAILGLLGRSRTPDELFLDEEPVADEEMLPERPAGVRAASTPTVLATGRPERARGDDGGTRRRRRRRGGGSRGSTPSSSSSAVPPTPRPQRRPPTSGDRSPSSEPPKDPTS
jgi:CDP-diacylglycerol---serine O-phosphatidyltransferase